ncbi:hypothetical protein L3X38_002618 [Prunus dulcis]|uniref:Transposable element protein n=1 Tax=Prunus dulcis TaxID=3755 RepID=A0AAD4WWE9_PRUDU|nr:hypothetical protein L3X38_002618 [Prunus dulcis]
MGVSKPLSGCTNTEEVLPYIEQHMIHIKTAYPKFRKRTKWLQDKHNSTFIQWLRFKVQSELEADNNGVSENLRWLAAGPNMAVPLYRSYLIKGIKFNIKAQDDVRTTQNSGVYLLAQTMQVASAKDKIPILSNMGFYGVIQEIWDLDYQKFTIPVFREYNDVIGNEVLGDVIIECEPFTRGMPNVDTFDELVEGEFLRKPKAEANWEGSPILAPPRPAMPLTPVASCVKRKVRPQMKRKLGTETSLPGFDPSVEWRDTWS